MRTGILVLAVFLLLSFAVGADAQCKYCTVEYGCLTCADTTYDAGVLCTLVDNGNICVLQGQCEGYSGPCDRCVINRAELRPRKLELRGEWQLVSVEITEPKATAKQRRRDS